MWTYQPASAPLGYMVEAVERGIIDITEERDYKCEWTLTDEHGNTRRLPFIIKGVKEPITAKAAKGDRFNHDGKNSWTGDGIRVVLPAGTLYDDIDFTVTATPSASYLTPVYKIADRTIPGRRRIHG